MTPEATVRAAIGRLRGWETRPWTVTPRDIEALDATLEPLWSEDRVGAINIAVGYLREAQRAGSLEELGDELAGAMGELQGHVAESGWLTVEQEVEGLAVDDRFLRDLGVPLTDEVPGFEEPR